MTKRIFCIALCLVISASLCSCRKLRGETSSDYEIITEYIYIDEAVSEPESIAPPTSSAAPPAEESEAQPEQGEEIAIIKPAEIKTTVNTPLCYIYLSKEQKRMYSIIYTAAENLQTGWFSLGDCSDKYLNNASIAYRALMSDHPEMFWLSKDFVVSRDRKSDAVYMTLSHTFDNYHCDYIFSADEIEEQKNLLEATVKSIADKTADLSDFEKELFFHDWLCENVTYNEQGDETIFTAYGALINKSAVCEGYSRAMQLLCKAVKIPCVVIYGSSRNSGHMWNMVCLENKWYHLDITWDDRYEVLLHTYFNLTDAEISADHQIYPNDISGESKDTVENGLYNVFSLECNTNKHNYFIYNNLTLSNDFAAAAQTIHNTAMQGKTFIEIKLTDPSLCNDVLVPITQIEAQLQLIPDCTLTISSYSLENDILLLLF